MKSTFLILSSVVLSSMAFADDIALKVKPDRAVIETSTLEGHSYVIKVDGKDEVREKVASPLEAQMAVDLLEDSKTQVEQFMFGNAVQKGHGRTGIMLGKTRPLLSPKVDLQAYYQGLRQKISSLNEELATCKRSLPATPEGEKH